MIKIEQILTITRDAVTRIVPGVTAALILLGVTPALATLLTVYDYPFEDNTAPAGFTVVGTPTYSGGKIVLNGSSYLTKATPVTATDNFGIEVIWTPAANDSFNFYATINNGATNGWAVSQVSGFRGYCQGTGGGAFGASAGTATPGTAVRLAVVRSGGTATFYKNGVAQTVTSSAAVRATPTMLAIGASLKNTTPFFEGGFKGSIDEVRVFTFAAGQFSAASDLLA